MGIADSNSALVNRTADGVPLDDIWQEVQDVVGLYNAEKDTLVSLLTYKTTNAGDAIAQSLSPQFMEQASEVGVPRAISPDLPFLKVGYSWANYDLASRLSWLFLRSASAEQVRAQIVRMIESDRATIQRDVLTRVFSPAEGRNEFDHRVFGTYVGTDGIAPPTYMGRSWDATHSHLIPTGSVDLDSEDVELLCGLVTEHGFGTGGRRGRLVLLFNPADIEDSALTSWRAGVTNANTKKAKYDFIPSTNIPPFLTSETVVGAKPPADVDGVPVLGSYGPALIVSSEVCPVGYFAAFSTHGADHPDNAIAFRQHENPSYQGLLFLDGNQRRYPIVESFTLRSCGFGARRRGAWAVGQLTASSSYTAPTSFNL